MALISEYDRTLPAHFTMSNKTLIITANVGEETIYFYRELGALTTIIVLTRPECYEVQRIFLDIMNDMGTTVISLYEDQDFDPNYRLSKRSQNIIGNIISNNSFKKIIIHPKPASNSKDVQNRELYNFVMQLYNIQPKLKNKIYIYNTDPTASKLCKPNSVQKGIIQLYAKAKTTKNKDLTDKVIEAYMRMTDSIHGIILHA